VSTQHCTVADVQFKPRAAQATPDLDLLSRGIGVRVQKGQLVSEGFLRLLEWV